MKRSFFSSHWLKRWLVYIIILCAAIKGVQWWEGRGEGFRLYKIQEEIPYDSRWDVTYSPVELEKAQRVLQQRFSYLGHGFQCYAFESEDGQYVIKFFRYQRLRLPNILMSLPDMPFFTEWRKTRLASLARRKEYLLRSFKTSWQYAKDETAMLFVHLNTTQGLFQPITIVDLLGNEYRIDLDNYQFMLQRKAKHIKPTITSLVQEGNIEGAKARITQIFDLLRHCSQCGIQDTDGALIRKNNLGFLDDRAIYIDGGKLVYKEKLRSKKNFEKDLDRLRPLLKWLKQTHPELVDHFQAAQQEAVDKYDQFLSGTRGSE